MINRRKAIQNLALIIGGAVLLPPGVRAAAKNEIELKHLMVDDSQQKLLAAVCETIIPTTDTPGAQELGLHLFVIKMVDDCYAEKDQQNFVTGLNQLANLCKTQYNNTFELCTIAQREALLIAIEQKNTYPPELNACYRIIKGKTLQGYTQSKYFMTKVVVYELAPGRYNPRFPVK